MKDSETLLRLVDLSFSYGDRCILDKVNLEIKRGEIVALVGRSGCGKTTLLRCIAQLAAPTTGSVERRGETRISLLFQDALLQPWLTVRQVIELPGKIGGYPVDVPALLRKVRLEDCADMRPKELSGGMQRRVALARALAQDPNLLLLDEPYGNLDEATRNVMYEELVALNVNAGWSVLIVTHSLTEAVYIADRVIVLAGKPATVVSDMDVDEEKPRDISRVHSPSFLAKCHVLREYMQSDVKNDPKSTE